MAETTIEWTTTIGPDSRRHKGFTFNPWRGCEHSVLADGSAHPGCEHCYAEAMSKINPGALGVWGKSGKRVVGAPAYWELPKKWNAAAQAAGVRLKVFCASLADIFESWDGRMTGTKGGTLHRGEAWGSKEQWVEVNDVYIGRSVLTMDDVRRRLFELIDVTPWLDWLILTKRPANVPAMWVSRVELQTDLNEVEYRKNVWLLTSVSDQKTAEALVPDLLKLRRYVPVLGLSAEPLTGPIDLTRLQYAIPSGGTLTYSALHAKDEMNRGRPDWHWNAVDWVIAGGESGNHARPCRMNWIRSLSSQCKAAGVACFVKQLGKWPIEDEPDDGPEWPVVLEYGHEPRLDDKKGGDWSEWPDDLKVREFPVSASAGSAERSNG